MPPVKGIFNLREPRHCGSLKGDWFDRDQLISPLDPKCASHFRFAPDGAIYPNPNSNLQAEETIAKLGLNIRKLQALREAAIKELESLSIDEIKLILYSPKNNHFLRIFHDDPGSSDIVP